MACLSVMSNAQVIPDLTNGDYFRPQLTETQKREAIINSFQQKTTGNISHSSQELNPALYKYANRDYTAPIRGTSGDPANAITNYPKTTLERSQPSVVPATAFNANISIAGRNQSIIDADLAAFQNQKASQEQILDEAHKEFSPTINYHLGLHSGLAVDRYYNAYLQLQQMLSGIQKKIDFLKAVWLVENAVDPSLTWEELNGMIQEHVAIISQLMDQEKLSRNDNIAKLMSIYKFMCDTTTVYMAARERNVVSKPFLYDFDDYEAKNDITKVFISKLLRTGSGQCMSLPMLYYLYSKALGAEAYLAFAPDHTYVTFKDNRSVWQNIELTAGMLTTSDFYWQSGFVKAEQVRSGIYLRPITEKETIAYLLTTLTLAYVKKFGTDERVLEMGITAKNHFPNSLTANMILAGYQMELWKHVQRQYDVYNLSETQLNRDEAAQAIKDEGSRAISHIYQDLGWTKMPEWAYKRWLKGVTELANRKQHLVRKRQIEQQLNR